MDVGIIRSIARLALVHSYSESEISDLVAAFDMPRLRAQLVALGLCEPEAGDTRVAKLYFSRRCSAISPNPYFDEAWYVQFYDDVRLAIRSSGLVSGFVHFVKEGLRVGRWPNPVLHAAQVGGAAPPPCDAIDDAAYLAANPQAASFIAAFPFVTARDHYNLYGRFLGYGLGGRQANPAEGLSIRAAEAEFDAGFYAATYLGAAEMEAWRQDAFGHYLRHGMRLGHSPNGWFQEDWYRAFYQDVRDAIAQGWLPSGFYHYVVTGRAEGRLPKYDLTAALEARIPGITDPALLQRADMLRQRLAGLGTLPRCVAVADRPRMIWLMLPNLNPDIMYGGFRAAVELVCAFYRDGHGIGVVCMEGPPNADYFLWAEQNPRIRNVFAKVPILALEEFVSGSIGPDDLFIAYTVWDLRACSQLAARTENKLPILLAQEYEPIFYDNGAQRALCEACYQIPHYPVVNSGFLLAYLARHRLGVFGRMHAPQAGAHYAVFEHKINRLPVQSATAMAGRHNRVFALYARPEAHAARNVLEIAILALQALCNEGAFGPEWIFVGLGALSKLPAVALGSGHELTLLQKIPERDYQQLMGEMDIGLSLMYAPHPSVVPFEFATTGALVITNTYENRSAEQLRQICANIIPCGLSVESLCGAIRTALTRVADFEHRAAHALCPATASWDAIFSHEFISTLLTNAVGSAPGEVATVVEFPKLNGAPGRPPRSRGKNRRVQMARNSA